MCGKNLYFSFDYLESPTYPVNENKVAKYVEILKVNVNMEMYLKKSNNDFHFWIFENLFPLTLAFSRKEKKDPPQIKSVCAVLQRPLIYFPSRLYISCCFSLRNYKLT